MMKIRFFRMVFASALVACVTPLDSVHAHHSFAMFDQTRCELLSGQVIKFQLAYPHAWLWVSSVDATGKAETWAFEGADPTSLRLRGWTNSAVKIGDKVRVAYSPLADGRAGGAFAEVLLPDGSVLKGPKGPNFAGALKYCEVSAAK